MQAFNTLHQVFTYFENVKTLVYTAKNLKSLKTNLTEYNKVCKFVVNNTLHEVEPELFEELYYSLVPAFVPESELKELQNKLNGLHNVLSANENLVLCGEPFGKLYFLNRKELSF